MNEQVSHKSELRKRHEAEQGPAPSGDSEWIPYIPWLEARLSKTEKALYNTIEEGVAHAFINIDHDDKRARVLTQEEVAALQRAKEALAGESDE